MLAEFSPVKKVKNKEEKIKRYKDTQLNVINSMIKRAMKKNQRIVYKQFTVKRYMSEDDLYKTLIEIKRMLLNNGFDDVNLTRWFNRINGKFSHYSLVVEW